MLTLDFFLNFNITTTPYQCANSKMDSEKRKQYFGDMDSAFPRLNVFLNSARLGILPAGGVWGGMRAY